MKWSNENTLEFLDLYKEHPVIWNHANGDHQNRQAVANAWTDIKSSLSFECTMENLKNKKDSLMGSFRKILRRINDSGIPYDVYSYNSDWFAYKTMVSFLLEAAYDHKQSKKTRVIHFVYSRMRAFFNT